MATIETDENFSMKSQHLSSEPSLDNSSSSSSQPQSSMTPSILPPSPLVHLVTEDLERLILKSDDSYTSPDIIKNHKLSSNQVANPRDFFEQCLMKLYQNDPALLSLDIECQNIGEHEITRFTDALTVNSTLLELSIIFQQHQLTEGVATQLVEALKPNSTLTRLSLKENRIINDPAATQLSDILRFNTAHPPARLFFYFLFLFYESYVN